MFKIKEKKKELSFYLSALPVAQNCVTLKVEVTRRSANFHPSVWEIISSNMLLLMFWYQDNVERVAFL